MLAESDETLRVYINETHMSYLPVFQQRADARFALGQPAEDVLRELWMASRCYGDHGEIFLAKWPHHQLRRRRLTGLEVAIAAGDADVVSRVGDVLGLDAMTVLAGVESDAVGAEISALTPHFRGGRLVDAADVAGTLAVCYCLALSAIAMTSLESFAASVALATVIRDAEFGTLRGARGGLGRVAAAIDALAAIRARDAAGTLAAIERHGELHAETWLAKAADDPAIGDDARGIVDTTSLALLACATALSVDIGPHLDGTEANVTLAYAGALGHSSVA